MNKATVSYAKMMSMPASYAIGLSILYFRLMVNQVSFVSMNELLDSLLLLAGSTFLMLYFVGNLDKYGSYSLLYAIIILYTFLLYFRTGETAPFSFTIVLITTSTAAKARDIIRLWLYISIWSVGLIVAIYVVTYLLDIDSLKFNYRSLADSTVMRRNTLFLNHANMAAMLLMTIGCTGLYLNADRITFAAVIGSLAYAFLIYQVTGSQTSSSVMAVSAIAFYLQSAHGLFESRLARVAIALMPAVLFIATYLIAGPLYNDGIGSMLTGRTWLWHTYNERLGVTVFGQPLVPVTASTVNGWLGTANTLDSFYAFGLYVAGLVFCALYCLIVARVVFGAHDVSRAAVPFLLAMLALGVTEVHVINFSLTPLAFLLSSGLPLAEDPPHGQLGTNVSSCSDQK